MDRKAGLHLATAAADVQPYGHTRRLLLQKHELRDHHLRTLVVYGPGEEDVAPASAQAEHHLTE